MSRAKQAVRAAAGRRFEPYPAYRDSGVEWLEKIPGHWEVKQLRQAVETLMDFRGRTPTKLGMAWGGDIPAISAVNVRDGYLDLLRGVNYGSQELHDRWMAQGPTRRGDVLFTTEAPLGNVSLVPDEHQYILSQRVVLLRSDPAQLMPEYLHRLLISSAFRQGVELMATGSTAEGVKRRYLMAMAVCVPHLEEQRTIAAFLDRETARIDALVAKKGRLIELLQEQRTALITRAVTKGLDPNVPMKDSGVEWLGEIPAHWVLSKMWRISSATSGGTPTKEQPNYWGGDIPWVSPKDMKRRFIDSSEDTITDQALQETGLKLVPPPAVLIVVRGMILAHSFPVAITRVPVTINQDMKALRLRRDIAPLFLAWLFEGIGKALVAAIVEEAAHGTRALRMDQWRSVTVPLPPEHEQRAITAFLDRETARIHALVDKIRDAIERLKELRTALVSAAVTGKIDVRIERSLNEAIE